ncbi:MAG: hypothetical protein ABSH16_01180 [Sedimentisphaerales bacterium]
MKIKSLLFYAVVITFVAVISYHFGGSMQGRNPNQKSLHIVTESNHSPCNTIDLSNKEQGPIDTSPAVNVPIKPEATKPQRTVRQYIPTITPDSIIDEQWARLQKETSDLESRISHLDASTAYKQQQMIELQEQYNAKKAKIQYARQQLLAVKQLKEQGSIDEEEAVRAAWYIAGLPLDTVKDISLPKPTLVPVPPNTHGVVTGILFSEKTPMAVIDGKVVIVGQSIYGVKVIKIQDSYVEFDKSGIRWSQRVNEPPSTNWPSK